MSPPQTCAPAFLRQITLVMGQKQQLIWDLPAIDSLRINAAVYDVPDDAFRARMKELSAMLSLGAGLYEELLFRVVLVTALAFLARRVLGPIDALRDRVLAAGLEQIQDVAQAEGQGHRMADPGAGPDDAAAGGTRRGLRSGGFADHATPGGWAARIIR